MASNPWREQTKSGLHGEGGRLEAGLAEEASEAYKDVKEVVGVAHNAGISRIVASTKPIGVIKG